MEPSEAGQFFQSHVVCAGVAHDCEVLVATLGNEARDAMGQHARWCLDDTSHTGNQREESMSKDIGSRGIVGELLSCWGASFFPALVREHHT